MYQFVSSNSPKENNIVVRIQEDGKNFTKKYIKFEEFDKKNNKKTDIIRKFPIELYKSELDKFNKKERTKMLNLLQEAFYNGYNGDNENENDELLKKVSDDGNKSKDYILEDGKFTLCPLKDKFQLFYLVGACGAGKSYLAKEIIENYKIIYPKNEIFVISSLKEDATLDKLKYLVRIDPNTFLEEKPSIEEFKNSLVLFDDYENFPKNIYDLTIELINSISSTGRHFGINMICIQHNFTNYKATRLLLNEMTHCIVYPSSASNYALKYLLGNYCGIDRKQLKDIKQVKSRWVAIYRHHPNIMITQNEIKFL